VCTYSAAQVFWSNVCMCALMALSYSYTPLRCCKDFNSLMVKTYRKEIYTELTACLRFNGLASSLQQQQDQLMEAHKNAWVLNIVKIVVSKVALKKWLCVGLSLLCRVQYNGSKLIDHYVNTAWLHVLVAPIEMYRKYGQPKSSLAGHWLKLFWKWSVASCDFVLCYAFKFPII